MPIPNAEIADTFDRLADLLEVEGANPFRVRAYRNAARVVRGYGKSMADLIERGEDLTQLPEIGEDLAKKIKTLVDTGKLPLLETVEARTPATLSDLMKIQGLGPKRVKTLYEELRISDLEDLKRAAQNGKIREIKGFGQKTEEMIRERVKRYTGAQHRTLLKDAEQIVEPLVKYLKQSKGIEAVVVAGSYRRRKETVGDLDILVTAKRGTKVMDDFAAYDQVDEVLSKGETRSTVRLHSGISVDLRVVPKVSYGAALHYFTGSKAHNIAVRKRGVERGYKINEYGVFEDDKRIAGKTEEAVYEKVGLPYIPPELREDRGEVAAAEKDELPDLIALDDIRGDLHCHTQATDGHNTLEQMVQAAVELGYDYLSITDHSQRVTMAHGLNEKRLREQIEAIDRLNEKFDGLIVLKSIECDILEDGSLDLPDAVLKELDFTVCSVHYQFNLSRQKQTERILRAMDNPYFNIFAHPTGRLINEREPYPIDLEKIMEGARERGCFLEVNAQPQRLDLTDDACKMAKEMHLRVVISSDAHSTANLEFMRFGVDQARRGWLEAKDVINTLPLKQLTKLLSRT
ncbi:DNA polymerase/3'-5' exonuclease PolX [Methylohalobius crimeensis]|uniref:DNA polymerase/3'-5' exonuclease PolX n=1 Tax=Methylohalobius crimeensis TaxID=244365 RepID=UPI0003B62325|nr:DNA polymerase/3'-5' exonuclease PolX [Methylohalobius crimeensis]